MKSVTIKTSVGEINMYRGEINLNILQRAIIELSGINRNTPLENVIKITNNVIGNLEVLSLSNVCGENFETFRNNVIENVRNILKAHGYKAWDKVI